MAVWGWPLVQVVLKSSSEDWGSKASPALGMEGGPVWVQGALLWIQVPAVVPTVFHRTQGHEASGPALWVHCFTARREFMKLRFPGISQTYLCGQSQGVCMLTTCFWESLALTFCEWRPWDHAKTATRPQSTAGPCWGPCPAHGWLQMGWASGDSCVHYQGTTNSNSGPASFFLWTENVFPVGQDKGQKIRPGPQRGHLLFRACIPGSVGGHTRTPPHTTEAEGLGTDNIFWSFLLFFETSWPCHLSLTPPQSLLACLAWTEGARGDWHLFRSCVCWKDRAQSRPVPCLLSVSPGTTLPVYLGMGPRQVPHHSFSVKASRHTYRHLFLFHPTLLSVVYRTVFVSPLIVWLDI